MWGSYEDLSSLYNSFDGLWNNEDFLDQPDFNSRESIITSILYEIRKAFQGNRLERTGTHFHFNDTPYLGYTDCSFCMLFDITHVILISINFN